MALPTSGPISLADIAAEFGGSTPHSLSEYYGAASGVPASGTIDFADFYGTSAIPPDPIASGLLFNLDARLSSSWPGSGSTWYDTTSNNRDCSLINGPTGGTNEIIFDGSDDYGQYSNQSWIPELTNPFSAEAYVYINSFAYGSFYTNERNLFSKTAPSVKAMSLGFEQQSDGNVYMRAGSVGASGGNVNESYDMGPATNWLQTYFHAAWTYDANVVKFYLNGSLVKTTGTGKTFGSNSAPLYLMALDPSNGRVGWHAYVDGRFKFCRMYGRALTDAEVYNNSRA